MKYMLIVVLTLCAPVYSDELDDFLMSRIRTMEQSAVITRNQYGKDYDGYYYMCGRVDSYYDALYKKQNPDENYPFYELERARYLDRD